jgi:protocatechuate 3,4-dioxygenase beta subunit
MEFELHDQGLVHDLTTMMSRRRALKLIAGAGLFTLASCAPGTAVTTTGIAASGSDADCDLIPEETAGPFPGDGSNGPNVLAQSGVVRGDIRSSFGDASGVAEGIPLTIRVIVQDQANGCAPFTGAAVYLWHCNRDGDYSIYSEAVAGENYLRGVQEASDDGSVTFTSIFPGCYSGRWPHIHFEVFPSLEAATDSANKIATSQIAFPAESCRLAYATAGYEQSIDNLSRISLETDNVFSDGVEHQLGTVTGGVEEGFVVELTVTV